MIDSKVKDAIIDHLENSHDIHWDDAIIILPLKNDSNHEETLLVIEPNNSLDAMPLDVTVTYIHKEKGIYHDTKVAQAIQNYRDKRQLIHDDTYHEALEVDHE